MIISIDYRLSPTELSEGPTEELAHLRQLAANRLDPAVERLFVVADGGEHLLPRVDGHHEAVLRVELVVDVPDVLQQNRPPRRLAGAVGVGAKLLLAVVVGEADVALLHGVVSPQDEEAPGAVLRKRKRQKKGYIFVAFWSSK